jgi:hypothetical protein
MPNGRKTFQMDINISTSPIERPYKIYQNLDFWFENRPSGNPVAGVAFFGKLNI